MTPRRLQAPSTIWGRVERRHSCPRADKNNNDNNDNDDDDSTSTTTTITTSTTTSTTTTSTTTSTFRTCLTAPRGFVFCEVPFPGSGIVAFEGRKNMRSFSFCL